ncbi:MAG: thiamine pyrophosphate-binding protein [Actinomycetota bacterium]
MNSVPRKLAQEAVSTSIGGATPAEQDLSFRLVDALKHLGVRWAFGVSGGGIARVWRAVIEGLDQVHFSHEQGAAFAAIEMSVATGDPVVVYTTTGPGITNAITGLVAARYEGARLILISPRTSPAQRGLVAVQETPGMMPSGDLFNAGWLFDDVFAVDAPEELETCLYRLEQRLLLRGPYLAHISIPVGLQNDAVGPLRLGSAASVHPAAPDAEAVALVADRLQGRRFFVWVGHGARRAYPQVRELVERTGSPVVATPRGKGIVSDRDPHLVMVGGLGGHLAGSQLAAYKAEVGLVLGSRLGEASGGWDSDIVPAGGLIQVDEAPGPFGPAGDLRMTVQGDVGQFLEMLIPLLDRSGNQPRFPSPYPRFPRARKAPGVRPQYLMGALERHLIARDCPILVEPGSAMAWATHWIKVPEPGLLRLPSQFGSMGHMTCGVVGRALAGPGPAACLTGDGSMLMAEEVHTAVDRGVRAIWIVLNDARYTMVEAGMSANAPFGSQARFTRCDFSQLAQGWGAASVVVEQEDKVDSALEAALASGGPCIVDIRIDPNQIAPFGARLNSLARQQGGTS